MSSGDDYKEKHERGILFSSGLVAGDAIIGLVVAFMIGSLTAYADFYDGHEGMMNTLTGSLGPWFSLIMFVLLTLVLGRLAFKGIGSRK